MKAIVNVTQNWGIGYEGKLVSYITEDMKHFKFQTKNKAIIYGNSTLKSFPNKAPLKNRINIVITKDISHIDPKTIENSTIINDIKATKKADNSIALQYILNEKEYLNKPILIIAYSIEQAIEYARKIFSEDSIIVCGGSSIYKQMVPLCDTIMVTKNYYNGPIDAYFPNLDEDPNWVLAHTYPLVKDICIGKNIIKRTEICSYNIYKKAQDYKFDYYWRDIL